MPGMLDFIERVRTDEALYASVAAAPESVMKTGESELPHRPPQT